MFKTYQFDYCFRSSVLNVADTVVPSKIINIHNMSRRISNDHARKKEQVHVETPKTPSC